MLIVSLVSSTNSKNFKEQINGVHEDSIVSLIQDTMPRFEQVVQTMEAEPEFPI